MSLGPQTNMHGLTAVAAAIIRTPELLPVAVVIVRQAAPKLGLAGGTHSAGPEGGAPVEGCIAIYKRELARYHQVRRRCVAVAA